ncbi:uncharacterized protein BO88DRAFT_353881 [Aspergillus vadensis CBS 113365]|uniref:Uncharacterized protein n=1 Tax=Aspergillus vadensis (strain CBS 113365 / IMI 142717 / IBT 24658) TaxID=1448311 RepID=A0A319ASD1_ASPVC|nr:hypothetical protein BO88DRAFT_353881 [Aspergillus vadensis CBS 113365]PYH63199.1 hypothetical protein BO88DRAFT_353881 [Aspergillus vadensis CBS 113365]
MEVNMTTNMETTLDTIEGPTFSAQRRQLPHRPPTPTPPPASIATSTSIPPPAPTTTHPPFPFPSPSSFTHPHPHHQQQQQPPPPPYHFHPPKSVTWGPITEIPIYSPSPTPSPQSSPSTSWIDLSSTTTSATSSTAALTSSSTFSPTIPKPSPPRSHPIIHRPLKPIRKPPTQLDNEMFYRNLYHMSQISTLRLNIVYDALSFLGGDFLDQVLLMEEGYLMQVAVMHARQAQQRDFARFSVAAGGGGGAGAGYFGGNGGFGAVIPRRPSPVKGGRVEKRKMRKMMKKRKASDVMGAEFWEQVNEREEGYEIDEDEDMDTREWV